MEGETIKGVEHSAIRTAMEQKTLVIVILMLAWLHAAWLPWETIILFVVPKSSYFLVCEKFELPWSGIDNAESCDRPEFALFPVYRRVRQESSPQERNTCIVFVPTL